MKILAVGIVIYLLFFTNMMVFLHDSTWQLPLWFTDLSWFGVELITALAVTIVILAIVVVITLGLAGAGGVVVAGTILAFLFGSLMIAWPLLIAGVLCWLIAGNKKVPS